jgi:hypothetical protein
LSGAAQFHPQHCGFFGGAAAPPLNIEPDTGTFVRILAQERLIRIAVV